MFYVSLEGEMMMPGTLATLAASYIAGKAAGKTAELPGGTPEEQRFAANLAGAVAAAGGAEKVYAGLQAAGKANRTRLRARVTRARDSSRIRNRTNGGVTGRPCGTYFTSVPSKVQTRVPAE